LNIRGLIWYADIVEKLEVKHKSNPMKYARFLKANRDFVLLKKDIAVARMFIRLVAQRKMDGI